MSTRGSLHGRRCGQAPLDLGHPTRGEAPTLGLLDHLHRSGRSSRWQPSSTNLFEDLGPRAPALLAGPAWCLVLLPCFVASDLQLANPGPQTAQARAAVSESLRSWSFVRGIGA